MLTLNVETTSIYPPAHGGIHTDAGKILELLLVEGLGEECEILNGFLDIQVYRSEIHQLLLEHLADRDRDSPLDMVLLCHAVAETDAEFTSFLIDHRHDYDQEVNASIATVIADSPFLDQCFELLEPFQASAIRELIRYAVGKNDESLSLALLLLCADNLQYESDESIRAGTLILLRRLGSAAAPCFDAVFETAIYDASDVVSLLAAKTLVSIDRDHAAESASAHHRFALSHSSSEIVDRCKALIREVGTRRVPGASS